MDDVQTVVYNHFCRALHIRNRGQIFIRHEKSLDKMCIVAYAADCWFLYIRFHNEIIKMTAAMPDLYIIGDKTNSGRCISPIPKGNSARRKWAKDKRRIFFPSHSPAAPYDILEINLSDPYSIHIAEYYANNIITTVKYMLVYTRHNLYLKEGLSHKFNLIENARKSLEATGLFRS